MGRAMRLLSACLAISVAVPTSGLLAVHAQTADQTPAQAPVPAATQAPAQELRADSTGTLTGVLVGRDDEQPVPYGTVSVVGTEVARFTDAEGRFRLVRVPPGTYTLRARQIGYAPKDTTITIGPAQGEMALTVRMVRLPPLLTQVEVEGHRPGECVAVGIPDSAADPQLAAIFARVWENVDRYRILWDEYPYHYSRDRSMVMKADQGRDSTWGFESGTYETTRQRPYQVGAVMQNEVDSAGRVRLKMFIPTFRDLADTSFLVTHCFTYGGREHLDSRSSAGVLRVDFRPATAIQSADVSGSLYFDADRLVVRRAVFRLTKPQAFGLIGITVTASYRELVPLVPVLDEVLTLQPFPHTASLAIGERTLVIDDRFGHYVFQERIPGQAEPPSTVASLPTPSSAPPPPTAVVQGRVLRTDGTPVEGAAVAILASTDSTATSDSGRFVLRNISPGPHMLSVRGVGIRPTRVAVTLSANQPRTVTIKAPPAEHVLAPVLTTARYPASFIEVGLDKRMQAGVGNIITFDQIEHRHAVKMSQLLQNTRGIHLRTYFDPDARIMSSQGGCVAFVLDGVPQKTFSSHDLDNMVGPEQIAAIEIYSPAEAPIELRGGVAPAPTEETIKGEPTPSGVTYGPIANQTAPNGSPAPPVTPVLGYFPEPCAVMVIWTKTRLKITSADTSRADSGYRATASRETEINGTAVFPADAIAACEPPTPTDAIVLDVYAALQDALPTDARDSVWIDYSNRVLTAVKLSFAFPNELALPLFGYASTAQLSAKNHAPRGSVVSPALMSVVGFTLSPSGALLESHLGVSSMSGDADTSILAAIAGAAANHAFPKIPARNSAPATARFDLIVSTTPPDSAQRAVLVDQIDVPVWPLGRAAALSPGTSASFPAFRSNPSAAPDSATFQFAVDENGKVIPQTVQAISQTAARAANPSYREFVGRIVAHLSTIRFEPALVGRCPVPQVVLQPFTD